MEKMQFFKLPTKSKVLKYLHRKKVVMMAQKILKKITYSRVKRKTVTLETFKSDPSHVTMIERAETICAEMQKIRIPGRSRKQTHTARVHKYYSSSVCRNEYF